MTMANAVRASIVALALLVALAPAPAPAAAVHRAEVVFGLMPVLPLAAPGTPAPDYVPGGFKKVRAVVAACGGRQIRDQMGTDGGAAVQFMPPRGSRGIERARACVHAALPQVRIDVVPAD